MVPTASPKVPRPQALGTVVRRTVRMAGNCVFFRRVNPTLHEFWEPLQLRHSLPRPGETEIPCPSRRASPVCYGRFSPETRARPVTLVGTHLLERWSIENLSTCTSASSPQVVQMSAVGSFASLRGSAGRFRSTSMTDLFEANRFFRVGPCVDGSELARRIFTSQGPTVRGAYVADGAALHSIKAGLSSSLEFVPNRPYCDANGLVPT